MPIDIRIVPASGAIHFTSSLDTITSLIQETSGSLGFVRNNTASADTVLFIDGVNGRLFSVSDSLDDTLFSVNNISGLPIFEVMADGTVTMGSYGTPSFVASGLGNSYLGNNSIFVSSSAEMFFSGSSPSLTFHESDVNGNWSMFVNGDTFTVRNVDDSYNPFFINDFNNVFVPYRLSIGTTDSPKVPLDVNGNVLITGSLTVTANIIGTGTFDFDNLRIDGNTISSTNTNGDIILDTNGSGLVDVYSNLRLRATSGGQSVTTLIPSENSGNSRLKFKGENFNHNIQYETGWNSFIYSQIVASYDGSHTYQDYYLSNGAGATVGTTRISTGTSYFTGSVGINTQTPTVTLDVNGVIRAVTSVTSSLLNIDNVRIDGNTISSTNTNGDLILSPNGTGGIGFRTGVLADNSQFTFTRDNVGYSTGETPIAVFQGSIDQIGLLKVKNNNVSVGSSAPSAGIDFDVFDGETGLRMRYIIALNKRSNVPAGGEVFHLSPKGIRFFTHTSASFTASVGHMPSVTLNGVFSSAPILNIQNGAVGINSLTPLYTLDVGGTFRATTAVTSSLLNIDNIQIDGNRISATSGHLELDSHFRVTSSDTFEWGTSYGQGILSWDTGKVMIGAKTSNNLEIWGGGSSRMFVSSSGLVGIGTTNPLQLVDIVGNSADTVLQIRSQDTSVSSTEESVRVRFSTSDATYLGMVGYLYRRSNQFGVHLSSKDNLIFESNGSLTGSMIVSSSGFVGIGTLAPSSTLHVNSSTGNVSSPYTSLIVQSNPSTTTLAGGGTAILFRGVSSGGNHQNYDQARIRSVGFDTNNQHGFAIDTKPNFDTALTERLRITGGGDVGIGTTAPLEKLHVEGDVYIAGSGATIGGTNLANGWLRIGTTLAMDGNEIIFSTDSFIGTSNGSPLYLKTNDANRITILSNGNVGIGTTTPNSLLNINGGELSITSSASTPTILLYDSTAGNDPYIRFVPETTTNAFAIGVDDSDADKFKISYGSNAVLGTADRITIDTSGLVGINDSAPTQRLTIRGNILASGSVVDLFLQSNTDTFVQSWRTNGNDIMAHTWGGGIKSYFDSNHRLHFGSFNSGTGTNHTVLDPMVGKSGNEATGSFGIWTGGLVRLFISSSAYVGIGTTTPNSILTLNDSTGLTINSGGTIMPNITRDGSDGGMLFRSYNSGTLVYTNLLKVTPTGNVGIGTSTPSAKLDVNGNVITTGSLTIRGVTATDSNPPIVNLVMRAGYGTGTSRHGIGFYVNESTFINSGIFAPPNALAFFVSNAWSTTNAIERMRIDGSGNVGIGTTSPNAPLFVSIGGVASIPALGAPSSHLAVGNGVVYGTMIGTLNSGVGYIQQQRFDGTATAYNLLLQPNGGNVGIGTTDAQTRLRVVSDNNTTALRISIGNSATYNFSANSTSGYSTTFHMDDTGLNIGHGSSARVLNLQTNSTNRLTILGDGKVGIGITIPTVELDVSGSMRIVGTNGNSFGGFNSNLLIRNQVVASTGIGASIGFGSSGLGHGGIGAYSEAGAQASFISLFNRRSTGDITESFRIDSSLRAMLGGGVTSTTVGAGLHISGSGTATLRLQTADRVLNITQGNGSSNALYDTNNFHEFQTDGGTKLIISDTFVSSSVAVNVKTSIVDVISVGSIGLVSTVIATVNHSVYTTVFFDYSIKNGVNMRAGTVIAVYNGTNVEWTESGTVDLGNTQGVTLSVDVSGGNIRLNAIATTTGWTVKTMFRGF